MNDNERKSKGRDIQERAFSFACRTVKFYQFLAKQKDAGEALALIVYLKNSKS